MTQVKLNLCHNVLVSTDCDWKIGKMEKYKQNICNTITA